MMNPSYKGRALLPMPVIEAARAGDAEAVEQVLRYYEGYINKLCTRTLYDEYGNPYHLEAEIQRFWQSDKSRQTKNERHFRTAKAHRRLR